MISGIKEFKTGLGDGIMLFDNSRLLAVTLPVQTKGDLGQDVWLNPHDSEQVLTAKYFDYKYTTIEYCHCRRVKTLGGLVCGECRKWNNLNR